MKKTKATILVPIYNAEQFLEESLNCLVSQTLKDIEIVCINDGSTDNSPKIIKKFQQADDRIVVIEKENTGYGDSINRGIEKATGNFIAILEPDDFIESNAYEEMYNCAIITDADVVKTNYFHFLKGKDTIQQIIPTNLSNKLSNPMKDQFIFCEPPAVWSFLFRKSFLDKNNIRFLSTPGASYQDAGFVFKVLSSTSKVFYLDKAFLHYRRDNEASSVHQKDKLMCVDNEFKSIENFLTDTKKIDKLCNVMEKAKFRSYCWNLCQLSTDLSREFLDVIKKEFREAEKKYPKFTSAFNNEEKGAYFIIMKMPKAITILFFKLYRRAVYGKY